MKRKTKNQLWVGLIAFIFIGSMFGLALNRSDIPQNPDEIPEEHILTKPLTEQQQYEIISRGGVVLSLNAPENCGLECLEISRQLEGYANLFSPFLYVVKIEDAQNFSVVVQGYKETRTLETFNSTAIEDTLCDNIPYRVEACILRKL